MGAAGLLLKSSSLLALSTSFRLEHVGEGDLVHDSCDNLLVHSGRAKQETYWSWTRSYVMLFYQDYMIGCILPLEVIVHPMAHGSLTRTLISFCRSGVVFFVFPFLLDVASFL